MINILNKYRSVFVIPLILSALHTVACGSQFIIPLEERREQIEYLSNLLYHNKQIPVEEKIRMTEMCTPLEDVQADYHPVLERYVFTRQFALASFYLQRAENNKSPMERLSILEVSNGYLRQGLDFIGAYIDLFKSAEDASIGSDSHLCNLIQAYDLQGKMAEQVVFNERTRAESPEHRIAVDAFEKSWDSAKNYPKGDSEADPLVRILKETAITHLHIAYCNLGSVSRSEEYLAKAEKIQSQICSRDQEMELNRYSSSLANRKILYGHSKAASLSPDALRRLDKSMRDQQEARLRKSNELVPCQETAMQLRREAVWDKIGSMSDQELRDQKITDEVKSIEQAVSEKNSIDGVDLKGIYMNFKQDSRDKASTKCELFRFIGAFIRVGDPDGAQERLDALKFLVGRTATDKLTKDLEVLEAQVQVLYGNNAPWLALLQKAEEFAEKDRAAKKAKKERTRQRTVAGMRTEIASKIASKVEEQPCPLPESKAEREGVSEESIGGAAGPAPAALGDSLSAAEEKALKAQRHEKADTRREAEAKEKLRLAAVAEEKTPASSSEATVPSVTAPQMPLGALYTLTKTAKKVDAEINKGTFKFTTQDMKVYFEAMGCEYKNGGNHSKLSLPDSEIVKMGDEVITIFSDFGGAVTIPPWKKGYVPDYFKAQILAACQKLRELKLKANREGAAE